MQIEYENSLKDLFSFSFYHVLRRRIIQFMLLLILITNFNAVYKLHNSAIVKFIMFLIISGIIFGFFGIILIISNYVTYRKSKNINLYSKHKLRLTTGELALQTDFSNTTYSWKAVIRVVQNRRLIMIYVQNNAAILIPKRIFNNEEEVVTFFKYAISTWKSASTI